MSDNFEHKCRQRSGERRTSPESVLAGEENFGAGSGGEWYDGGHVHQNDGAYQVTSPQIRVMAEGPCENGQNGILLQASGSDSFTESFVDVHADRRVRITTGGPDITVWDTNTVGGVRVQVETNQCIGLLHGPKGVPGSSIVMLASGMEIESEEGNIIISSVKQITLQVAGGTSSITLEPDQITIKGPMVYIN